MIDPNFYTKKIEATASYGKFSIEPLPKSFGNSMGSALRRTLLSSLRGAAITQLKIDGADHMFSTIKGVKESALELILNLKQLRFDVQKEGSYKISISVKGRKKVTGKDVHGDVKTINQDLYLGEVTDDKGKIELEALVETGVGSITEEEVEKQQSDYISVDAYFSPVTKVIFRVEEARVGRKTNYDRLVIEIWTDGTISPDEAITQASQVLTSHFAHILSGKDNPEVKTIDDAQEGEAKKIDQKLNDIIIDELNLPSRVI
ncbi:MAG: DNA-directed RNA polymerase subunit alpha, partial [Patescibacteria group bacterium]